MPPLVDTEGAPSLNVRATPFETEQGFAGVMLASHNRTGECLFEFGSAGDGEGSTLEQVRLYGQAGSLQGSLRNATALPEKLLDSAASKVGKLSIMSSSSNLLSVFGCTWYFK